MRKVTPLCQRGCYDLLGEGPKNIAHSGCLLCCITMAANAYDTQHRPWTLSLINKYLSHLKLFTGSKLIVAEGLKRVGLEIVGQRGILLREQVQAALEAGELVIVGVDYKEGASSSFTKADHFVLFFNYSEIQHGFEAIDPSSGRVILFDENTMQYRLSKSVNYRAIEQIILRKRLP